MTIIYRASELGGCVRMRVAKRLGYPEVSPPEKMQEVFDAGHETEDEVIRELMPHVFNRQQLVKLNITNEIVIEGHIDGMLDYNRILEVKSMAPDPWKEFYLKGLDTPGLVQKYKWQISCYMHATGFPLTLLVRNRVTKENATVLVEEPPYSGSEITQRVLEAEVYVREGVVGKAPCDGSYPCPVFYLHDEDADREVTDDPVVAALATQFSDSQVRARQAKALEADSKNRLLEALGSRTKVAVQGIKVTRYEQQNPLSYDMESIGREVDLRCYENPRTSHWRVKVTMPKEEQ